MWAGVTPAWADRADSIDERVAEVTRRLLDRAAPGPGSRVLELAAGPGGAGLAIAGLVGPGGEVVISDVAPGMVAAATARAEASGATNVRTAVLDLEAIAEPDRTYDAVLCREGLMFAVEPATAVAEIHRVLRPGGRVAASVWGARERNPWLGLVLDAVRSELGVELPPPGMPGPFALGDPRGLAQLFERGGLVGVEVEEVAVPFRTPSLDAWWEHTTTLAGPLATVLSSLPAEQSDAIRKRLRDTAAVHAVGAGYDFPGVCLVASAQRAATG
jgi:SAM-dependent methyltransferase